MMIEVGKKYTTRNGHEAIIEKYLEGCKLPFRGTITFKLQSDDPKGWCEYPYLGSWHTNGTNSLHGWDLMEEVRMTAIEPAGTPEGVDWYSCPSFTQWHTNGTNSLHGLDLMEEIRMTPIESTGTPEGVDWDCLVPEASEERKGIPIVTGVLDYFPLAIIEVAKLSKAGNDKHNPGEPIHWSRSKSDDHADCIGRHLLDRGKFSLDGKTRHSAALAWRALALLQLELESEIVP